MGKIFHNGELREVKDVKRGGGIWRGETVYCLEGGSVISEKHRQRHDVYGSCSLKISDLEHYNERRRNKRLLIKNKNQAEKIAELEATLFERTVQIGRLESIMNSIQARLMGRPRFK